MNIYRHSFAAVCPSDGDTIIYRMEIRTLSTIYVEHIKTATTLIKSGYQEEIADEIHRRFGGEQRIIGIHQGVEIETVRGAA